MNPWVEDSDMRLYLGDALDVLRSLPAGSADAIVTSPPYLDARPEYPSPSVQTFELIFAELGRVTEGGPFALNVGRLWRDRSEQLWWLELLVAAERAGWVLRDTLVWVKPNANPIQGELLTSSHEYVFLLGEGFNTDAVRSEYAPGSVERLQRRWVSSISVKGDGAERNGARRTERRGERRDPDPRGARGKSYVEVPTGREKGNPHPAPMPTELAEHLVRLTSWPGGTVVDPFVGSGTTLAAARANQRSSIGIDRAVEYLAFAAKRLGQQSLLAPVSVTSPAIAVGETHERRDD